MDELETITLEVRITRRKSDGEMSTMQELTVDSRKIAETWPTKGLVQMTYAMSIEALRREAWMMMHTMKSRMKPEEVTPEALSERLIGQMLGFVHDHAKTISQQTLETEK